MRARSNLHSPTRKPLRRAALLLAAGALLFGCRGQRPPPADDETVLEAVHPAPILDEPEDDGAPMTVLQPGTIVRRIAKLGTSLKWVGHIDGDSTLHEGSVLQVEVAGALQGYAFASDFSVERRAPSPASLCARIGGGSDCPSLLKRQRLSDGRLLVYETGGVALRHVAVVGDSALALAFPGIEQVRTAELGGATTALVRRRWADGKRSGARLIVVRLGPPGPVLEQVLDLGLDEVDAGTPLIHQSMLDVTVVNDTLLRRGLVRDVARDGGVSGEHEVREVYRFRDGRPTSPAP